MKLFVFLFVLYFSSIVIGQSIINFSIDSASVCSGDSVNIEASIQNSNQTTFIFPYLKQTGNEIFVSPNGNNLLGDGSQSNPYQTIQFAVNTSLNGGIVTLLDGIYVGAGNTNITTQGKQVTIQSENGPQYTTIDCNFSERAFKINQGETLSTKIKGLKIINGQTSSPPLGIGSAIFVEDNSGLFVKECIFENNQEGCIRFGDTEISGPQSAVEDCIFINNNEQLILGDKKSFYVQNCFFYSNSTLTSLIGNAHVANPAQYYNNCIFKCNYGDIIGALGHGKYLENSLFISNTSTKGVVYCGTNWSGTNTVDHCTFYNNSCNYFNSPWGDHTGQVKSSIFYPGDARDHISGRQSSIPFSYSLGNGINGNGNIQGNPLFVDANNNNFNFQPVSPCIGTGALGSDMGADISLFPSWMLNCLDYYSNSYSSLLWGNGQTTSEITIAPNQSQYIVVEFYSDNCDALISDSIWIEVITNCDSLSNLTSISASDSIICNGDSVDLTINGLDLSNSCDLDITNTNILPGQPIPGFTYGGLHNGHYYYVYNNPTSWIQGEAICRQNGGYLVSINDAAENSFVTNLTNSNMWIGLYRDPVTCQWTWLDCEPVTYTNWRPGEPNNNPCGEPYGQIIKGCSFGFNTWNNLSSNAANGSCYSNMRPVLEIDPTMQSTGSSSLLWSTGETSSSITVSPSQTTDYYCIITNNGVVDTIQYTITVSNPFVDAGAHISVCDEDTIVFAASGALTYAWSDAILDNTPFVATTSQYYYVEGTDSLGCSASDSIYVNILPNSTTHLFIDTCVSYLWPANGQAYNQSGQYSTILINQNGCDSTLILDLIVNQPDTVYSSFTSCDTYFWPANGQTYSQSGQYFTSFTNQFGCDSTMVLDLTINPSDTAVEYHTACNAFTWPTNGQTYSQSGQYFTSFTNQFGCDSTVVLDLTVNPSDTTVEYHTACDTFIWPANGQTYTQSGQYFTNFTNQFGCDSILMLNLIINNQDVITENRNACDSTFWEGQWLYQSGNYSMQFVNTKGCDSTINLVLNLTESAQIITDYFVCSQAEVGSDTLILNTANSCDSVVISNYILLPEELMPVANFSTNPNSIVQLPNGLIETINSSQNATSYSWDFGDSTGVQNELNPIHNYENVGQFDLTLVASNDVGCTDTMTLTIIVREDFHMYIPNTFTPNGTNLNEEFKPICSDENAITDYELVIYNRYGQQIYLTNQISEGWLGTFNNQECPSGVYVWKLTYTVAGTKETKSGHVSLLR